MEMNAESVLDALNDFERKPTEIPPILDDYLLRIAQNGEIIFPWGKLKPLLKRKLETVLDEFYETCPVEITVPVPSFQTFNFDSLKKTILSAVDAFSSAPFTIQRICELVTNPKKHYNRTDKYMRGIEKNVLVVSTIEPRIGIQNDANANMNPILNGIIEESTPHSDDCFNGHDNNENEASSNLNSPSNHALLDNFANVFPSAACIPSPSDICIGRDVETISSAIDSNFLPGSECIETQEVAFEASVPMDSENSAGEEAKVEQMDTSPEENEDEPSSEAAKEEEMSSETAESAPEPPSVKVEAAPEITEGKDEDTLQKTELSELPPENTEAEKSEVFESDAIETEVISVPETKTSDDMTAGDTPNEADSVSSESASEDSESATLDAKASETTEQCQQDDTVSQSDDSVSNDSSEVSQSDEIVQEATQNEDSSPVENVPVVEEESSNEEVSQSVEKTEQVSEQCQELESSTDGSAI